jgi:uncharacterized membrane protein YjfL (UPF0719 family)
MSARRALACLGLALLMFAVLFHSAPTAPAAAWAALGIALRLLLSSRTPRQPPKLSAPRQKEETSSAATEIRFAFAVSIGFEVLVESCGVDEHNREMAGRR